MAGDAHFASTQPPILDRGSVAVNARQMGPWPLRRARTGACQYVGGWCHDGRREEREGGPEMINAPVETLMQRPALRNLLSGNRCLTPANGFHEWKVKGERKVPHDIHPIDAARFSCAGLYKVSTPRCHSDGRPSGLQTWRSSVRFPPGRYVSLCAPLHNSPRVGRSAVDLARSSIAYDHVADPIRGLPDSRLIKSKPGLGCDRVVVEWRKHKVEENTCQFRSF
jgi:hypothetical protein